MPPSQITSQRSPTASRTDASSSTGAGAPSSWRPPWFDTITASMPTSAAMAASSADWMPFSITGPSHCSRNQSMSRHDSDGSNWLFT